MSTSERRLRMLTILNTVALCLITVIAIGGFTRQDRPQFTEIDAERINILGEDGNPVLVLANKRLMPGPSMNGKDYPPAVVEGRSLVSGMIFFNEEGDEVGGLIFNGITKDSGYSAVGHLSFDQWKQNQVIALQYIDGGQSRRAGLNIWDRPTDVGMDGQLDRGLRMLEAKDEDERAAIRQESTEARARGENGVPRLFVGSRDQTAEILLRDTQGRPRARLFVDAEDQARLEFLDESGTVIAEYPPTED